MILKCLFATFVSFSISVTYGRKVTFLPDYCADFEASIREYKMDVFVRTINEQYKEQDAENLPKTQQECYDTLDKLLTDCDIITKLQEKMFKRPLVLQSTPASDVQPNRINKTYEETGIIDIRTLNYTDSSLAPLVIKLRRNKKVCISLGGLVKFLDVEMFNDLYPNRRIILLALTFSHSGHPAVREWISLFYENGEIVGAQKNADCLESPEFADLKYKEKHLKEYFTKAKSR